MSKNTFKHPLTHPQSPLSSILPLNTTKNPLKTSQKRQKSLINPKIQCINLSQAFSPKISLHVQSKIQDAIISHKPHPKHLPIPITPAVTHQVKPGYFNKKKQSKTQTLNFNNTTEKAKKLSTQNLQDLESLHSPDIH